MRLNNSTELDLYIPDVLKLLREDKTGVHFLKGTLVCFCRKGFVNLKINFTEYHLEENDCLAILPTHMFLIETVSDDVEIEAVFYSEEYWASLSQTLDYQILRMIEYSPKTTIQDELITEVYSLLHYIRRHYEKFISTSNDIDRYAANGVAYGLLMCMVSQIKQVNVEPPRPATRKEILTKDFFNLLSKYFETERRVSFYASKLCVTPKHLSTMVKSVTKLSILDWINNVTVLNIKRRLRTTQDTIQQISDDLNFQTSSTFVRYFRKHTGITPSKYRSQANG